MTTLPNVSSFRGGYFNEDTTGSPMRTKHPDLTAEVSMEHAAFSDINIIETGGQHHRNFAINILLESGSLAIFETNVGQTGTLIVRGVTKSTSATLLSFTGVQYIVEMDCYAAQAEWVW